jgi:hypothetical protein
MPLEYEEKVLSYHHFIIWYVKRTNITIGHIGSVGGTPLTFDVSSNRTVASKGEKPYQLK